MPLFSQSLVFHLNLKFVLGLNQTFEDGAGLLHLAILAQAKEIYQFLINAGVDPSIRDAHGKYTLIYQIFQDLYFSKPFIELVKNLCKVQFCSQGKKGP